MELLILLVPGDQAPKAVHKAVRSTRQGKLRIAQNNWWTTLAKRTWRYADIGYMTIAVYPSLSSLFGQKCSPDKHQPWSDHFEVIFIAGSITGQDPLSGCRVTHPLLKRPCKLQCSRFRASHLALLVSQQNRKERSSAQ